MATSGTYTFDLTLADLVDEAYERAGVDPAELSIRHLKSARTSLALLFAEWSTKGVNEWAIEQYTQTLTASSATYDLPTGAIDILGAVLRRDGIDTAIYRISRYDYLELHKKTTEGRPDRYYVDRDAVTPQLTLWPTPENSTDAVVYFYVRRLQDTGSAINDLDVPYYWLEAMVSGLSAKLAEKFAKQNEEFLLQKAMLAFDSAASEDRDRTPIQFSCNFDGSGRW